MAVATLILAAGLALEIVLSMHTRATLVQFGAEEMIPTLQSASFFNELGPLVTGLLVAGRVGAGIGAGIANMRVTEQIDAIESLSIDAFKMLVVTRIVACILAGEEFREGKVRTEQQQKFGLIYSAVA